MLRLRCGGMKVAFDVNLDLLARALSAADLRHRVLANNVANVNTPGFKAARVEFESLLQEAMALGDAPLAVAPVVVRDNTLSLRPDGNNVDIDVQMSAVAANQLWYGALARSLSDEIGRLRAAISEGRR